MNDMRKRAARAALIWATLITALVVGLLNVFGWLSLADLWAVPVAWLIVFTSWYRDIRRGQAARSRRGGEA